MVTNAQAANAAAVAAGQSPPYDIAAIQAAANQQAQQFALENAQIWNYQNPGSPSTWPWYIWAIAGIALVLVVRR